MESVLSEYEASLADLTFNSKPHINMLTVLAEENVNFASDIVKIIETRIFEVQFKRKLPVLYLIDSIVKNFGGRYMKLFGHNLISVFLCVFDKADGKTRGDLYKLRSTWDGIFPARLLHELDKAVRDVDHHWPIRSKKHFPSRNPLSLGESTPPSGSFSADEDPLDVGSAATTEGENVEELVEEEEIEMDDESLGVLEMLEQKLKKRQAELSRLEYLESNKPEEYRPPEDDEGSEAKAPAGDDVIDPDSGGESSLQIDLNEYPVLPMDSIAIKEEIPPDDEKRLTSLDEDLADTKHWVSHGSIFESRAKRRLPEDFDRLNVNRVVSHYDEDVKPVMVRLSDIPTDNPPVVKVESTTTMTSSLSDVSSQTVAIEKVDGSSQSVAVEMKDESTQYRHRKKTKNFMSQYKVATKTIGTYFKIKCKDCATQYEAPDHSQDAAADSTCLPLEDDLPSTQLPSSTKDSQNRHSLQILRSLRRQREQGMLCDITLAAQGELFKAHKSILVACSDFFHTLFASEEMKQTPLSFIELQGITASALSLVLDYVYTSEVSVSGSVKSVQEIITAAKRLKIHSLFPVCEVLEEALETDQDLTGYIISNTELVGPDSHHSNGVVSGGSGSVMLASNDETERHNASEDEDDSDTSGRTRRSRSRRLRGRKAEQIAVDSSGGEKTANQKLLDAHRDKKPVKRKARSQSMIIGGTIKRRKSDELPEKPYPCPCCKKGFWKGKNLNFHLARSHPEYDPDDDDDDDDDEDKEAFIHADQASRRGITGSSDLEVNDKRCDQCSRTFSTAAQLAAHARKKHPRERKRRRGRQEERSPDKERESDNDSLPARGVAAENSKASTDLKDAMARSKDSAGGHSTKTVPSAGVTKPQGADAGMRLYHCEICEEVFSVQCFYKAHMANHRQNSDPTGLL